MPISVTDLYKQLFGKHGPADGDVISMAEHGRVGGLSTGQPFKYVAPIDPDTGTTLTGGSGTQYTEGDTDATITGNAMMWEDTGDTLRPVSAAKPLPVEIIAGAGSGGTASADDADFTAGTTDGTPSMGVYQSTPTNVTDGDLGIVGITQDRKLKVQADLGATDNAVLDAIQTATEATQAAVEGTLTVGSHAVTNAGTFAVQVDGDALTSLQLLDDAVAAEGAALGKGVLLQGDDGTDRKNINVDATTGDVQVDVTNTVTVDGSAVTQPVSASSLPLPTGAATAANQSTIIGHVDGIETLIGTTNSTLGTIDTDTGNISTKIDTIAGAVSGSEMQVDVVNSPSVVGNVAHNAADSGNPVKVGGEYGYATNSSPTTLDAGDRGNFQVDDHGNQRVVLMSSDSPYPVEIADAADSVTNSNRSLKTRALSYVYNGSTWDRARGDITNGLDVDITRIAAGTNAIGNVGITPRTSGGLDIFRSIDIDESEEEIKSSAGQLFSISAFNTTAAPIYLKFYNATAASVTVGTTTPVLTFVVPANADSDGAGFIWNNDIGLAFSTAMTVAATTGVADSDTGAPSANACIVNIGYK